VKVNRKILFEIGILLFSLFYLLSSVQLELGELSRPGPGFFPIILGAAGVVIASFLVVGTYLQQKKEKEKGVSPGGIESPSPEKDTRQGFIRIVAFILALTALVGLYEILGSLVGFFIVTVIFGKITGMRGWGRPLVLGFCTSAGIYILFGLWFKLPLPGGMLAKLF
jgi:putative tricarboxylic transport membrane protein